MNHEQDKTTGPRRARDAENPRTIGDGEVLVLTRKVGQQVMIGDRIIVKVLRIGARQVDIGVEAPPEVPIAREELHDRAALR